MVSVGSWGDAEPYLALAQELLTRNNSSNINSNHNHHHPNQVDFFVQQQYESRVQQMTTGGSDDEESDGNPFQSKSFRLHALPFSTRDFYTVKPSHNNNNNKMDPKLKHVETIAEIMGELVLPCAKLMHSIIGSIKDNRKIILSSALSRPLCWLLSRVLQIPMVLLHLQPLAPNTIFPLYRVSKNQCVQAIMDYSNELPNTSDYHETTYWKIDEPLEEIFLKDRITAAYEEFGLQAPSWSDLQAILRGDDPMVHIANCYDSNHLFPPIANTPGVGPHVHEIGPLADAYLAWNYTPDLALSTFLQACIVRNKKKPICIGFGSMPFSELSAIMDALLQLDLPAVLLGAPFQFRSCPAKYQAFVEDPTKVLRIGFAPYAYLLPECCMMLCHGGAGVVHATLRAGIPCLIRPIMGDQFLFASLLQEKGLGMEIGQPNAPLNAQDIVEAVRHVLQLDSSLVANCRQWRQTILQEEASGTSPHGTIQLANLLEDIHSKPQLKYNDRNIENTENIPYE